MSVFDIKEYVSGLPDFENENDEDMSSFSQYLHNNPNELSTLLDADSSYGDMEEQDRKDLFEFMSREDEPAQAPSVPVEESPAVETPVPEPALPPETQLPPLSSMIGDVVPRAEASVYDFADTVAAPQYKGHLDPNDEPISPGKAEVLTALFKASGTADIPLAEAFGAHSENAIKTWEAINQLHPQIVDQIHAVVKNAVNNDIRMNFDEFLMREVPRMLEARGAFQKDEPIEKRLEGRVPLLPGMQEFYLLERERGLFEGITHAMSRISSGLGDKIPEVLARAIRRGDTDLEVSGLDKYIEQQIKEGKEGELYTPEQRKEEWLYVPAIGKITFGHLEDTANQLGYSLANMLAGGVGYKAAALAGAKAGSLLGVPGQIAGTITGVVSAFVAGTLVSSGTTKDEFIDRQKEKFLKAHGGQINEETKKKWEILSKTLQSDAEWYGFWEAAPETVGNILTMAIAMTPAATLVSKIPIIKNIAATAIGSIAIKLALMFGEELPTEMITQKKQNEIDFKHGDAKKIISWGEAYDEVAPSVFLTTPILGGIANISNAVSKSGGRYTLEDMSKDVEKTLTPEQAEQIETVGKVEENLTEAEEDFFSDAKADEAIKKKKQTSDDTKLTEEKVIEEGKTEKPAPKIEEIETIEEEILTEDELDEILGEEEKAVEPEIKPKVEEKPAEVATEKKEPVQTITKPVEKEKPAEAKSEVVEEENEKLTEIGEMTREEVKVAIEDYKKETGQNPYDEHPLIKRLLKLQNRKGGPGLKGGPSRREGQEQRPRKVVLEEEARDELKKVKARMLKKLEEATGKRQIIKFDKHGMPYTKGIEGVPDLTPITAELEKRIESGEEENTIIVAGDLSGLGNFNNFYGREIADGAIETALLKFVSKFNGIGEGAVSGSPSGDEMYGVAHRGATVNEITKHIKNIIKAFNSLQYDVGNDEKVGLNGKFYISKGIDGFAEAEKHLKIDPATGEKLPAGTIIIDGKLMGQKKNVIILPEGDISNETIIKHGKSKATPVKKASKKETGKVSGPGNAKKDEKVTKVPKKVTPVTEKKKPEPKFKEPIEKRKALEPGKLKSDAKVGKKRKRFAKDIEIEVVPRIFELDEIEISHDFHGTKNPAFPEDKQNRDRDTKKYVKTAADRYEKFKAGKTVGGIEAATGSPTGEIIDGKLYVEAGTGRMQLLQQVYKNGGERLENYKKEVKAALEADGLSSEEFDKMKQPVHGFERVTPLTKDEVVDFVREGNKKVGEQLSASEKAKDDSKAVLEVVKFMSPKESKGMISPVTMDNMPKSTQKAFLEAVGLEEANELWAENELSDEGKKRLQNALYEYALGETYDTTADIEKTNPGSAIINKALFNAAPTLAYFKWHNENAKGTVNDFSDLEPSNDIAIARLAMDDMYKEGHKGDFEKIYKAFFDQPQDPLFGDPKKTNKLKYTDEALAWAEMFHNLKRSGKALSDGIVHYITAAKQGVEDMFSGPKIPSKREVLTNVIEEINRKLEEGKRTKKKKLSSIALSPENRIQKESSSAVERPAVEPSVEKKAAPKKQTAKPSFKEFIKKKAENGLTSVAQKYKTAKEFLNDDHVVSINDVTTPVTRQQIIDATGKIGSRHPNEPVAVFINDKGQMEIKDGNNRYFQKLDDGEKTIKVYFPADKENDKKVTAIWNEANKKKSSKDKIKEADKEMTEAWEGLKKESRKVLGNAPTPQSIALSAKLIKALFKKGLYTLQDAFTRLRAMAGRPLTGLSINSLKTAMKQLVADPNVDTSKVGMTAKEVDDFDAKAFFAGRPQIPIRTPEKNEPQFTGPAAKYWQTHKAAIEQSESQRKWSISRILKELNKGILDVSGNIKRKLLSMGPEGTKAVREHDLIAGASSNALRLVNEANEKLYSDMNKVEKDYFDSYINSMRSLEVLKNKPKFTFSEANEKKEFEAVIDQIPVELKKKIEDKAKIYWEIFDDQLSDLEKNGLLTKKSIAALKKKGIYYSPRRVLDYIDPDGHVSDEKKITVSSSGIQKLSDEGSLRQIEVDTSALLSEVIARAQSRIFRNNANKALYKIAKDNPDNGLVSIWKQKKMPEHAILASSLKKLNKMKENMNDNDAAIVDKFLHQGEEGVDRLNQSELDFIKKLSKKLFIKASVISALHPKLPPGYSSIDVMVGGKKETMLMPNEMAAEWIKSDPLLSQIQGSILSFFSGTSTLKAMATGYNPEFALTNTPRDIAHILLTTDEFSSTSPVGFAQLSKRIAEVSKDALTRKGRYVDYIKEGGGMEFLTHQGRSKDKPLNKTFAKLQEILGYVGETSEIVTRLALREQALKNIAKEKGVEVSDLTEDDRKHATWVARNYLDFSQGGSVTKAADKVIPYLGAGIQGTRGIFRAAGQRPGQTLYKMSQIGGVAALLYLLNTLGDDDKYKQVSPRDKVNYFNIPIPWGEYTDKAGNKRQLYFKIAKDQGQKIIASMAENMMAMALGKEAHPEEVAQAAGELSSVSFTNLPPVVKAGIAYFQNYDLWRAKQIWTKGKMDKDSKEFDIYTHDFWKKAGETSGLSPERMKTALQQFFTSGNIYSSMGEFAWNAMFEKASSKDKKTLTEKITKLPFIRRLISTTRPYTKFQKRIDEAKAEERTAKYINTLKLDELTQEYFDGKVEKWKIDQFIEAESPNEQKRLKNRFEVSKKLKDIPDRRWWLTIRGMSPELRASEIWSRWQQATPEKKQQLKEVMNKIPGIKTKGRFYNAINELGIDDELKEILKPPAKKSTKRKGFFSSGKDSTY